MGAVCFGTAGFLALSSLPRESSAIFCAAAGKFMEQREQLSLSLYCTFLIDLTQCVKAGSGFPTCSRMVDVSEIWGEKRCFPSQSRQCHWESCPPPVYLQCPFLQLLGFAIVIIKASLGNPIVYFMPNSKQRTHRTWQLACSHACTQTCTYTNMHVHTDRLLSPPLPSLCTVVDQNVPLLCFLNAGGRELSKISLCFHPDKARPSIYSM